MPKYPIQRKVADSKPRPLYLTPKDLAPILGCEERQARNLFRKHLASLPEALPGKHMRLGMPLSQKSRQELSKLKNPRLFAIKVGASIGDFDADSAEWLMLAQTFQQDISDETAPVPYLSDSEGDVRKHLRRLLGPSKARAAKRIQREILRRIEASESFDDLLLKGWIYQASRLTGDKMPTALEVMDLMGLSPSTFYERYPDDTFQKVCASTLDAFTYPAPQREGDPNRMARKKVLECDLKADEKIHLWDPAQGNSKIKFRAGTNRK